MFAMYEKYVKRSLGLLFSIIGLILFAPFFLLIAASIKIDSKGPVFFLQERIGKGGKAFTIYKFRTMQVGAEWQGAGTYAFKGDPRITRAGRFLRKTSMDETAQLLNILKGEMAFIGPRPVTTYHPCKYEEYTPEQKKRFLVRPGISGWAQVNGRNGLDWLKRLELDAWYAENISFPLDLRIFLKTILCVTQMKDTVVTFDTSAKLKSSQKARRHINPNQEKPYAAKADVHCQ